MPRQCLKIYTFEACKNAVIAEKEKHYPWQAALKSVLSSLSDKSWLRLNKWLVCWKSEKKKDAENTLHFKGFVVKAFVKSNALHTEQTHTWDVMVCALLVGQLRVLVLECLVCQALLYFYLLCSIVCVCGCLPDCRMRTWGVVVGASASVALHHVIKPASAHVSSSSSLSHCWIIDSATKSPALPSALTLATVAPVQPRTAYSSASICPTPPSRTSINLC